MPTPGWSPGRKVALVLALVAVAAAAVLGIVVVRAQVSAPEPTSAGRIDPLPSSSPSLPVGTGSAGADAGDAGPAAPAPLGPSRPTTISIPAIGVSTTVNPIGLAADGSLAVPQPGPHLNEAAWFTNSPSPGQPGPAIIEGHVDTDTGPSVFFRLGDIHPGDRVIVHRADGHVLTFHVDAVRDFLKATFPTRLVYGGRDLSEPSLRLITCSDFDASIHHHIGNEVVFAHLVHTADAS
ncbi:class F sortase [Nocardioides sp. Iso805N]|uniref:class F sortase n=1 Tax=Nocardioides sp. Iso805N TaxID=1283287 RepID=UPI00036BB96F|nr:class F sortase [Nocardioides sp. Iso805N]